MERSSVAKVCGGSGGGALPMVGSPENASSFPSPPSGERSGPSAGTRAPRTSSGSLAPVKQAPRLPSNLADLAVVPEWVAGGGTPVAAPPSEAPLETLWHDVSASMHFDIGTQQKVRGRAGGRGVGQGQAQRV